MRNSIYLVLAFLVSYPGFALAESARILRNDGDWVLVLPAGYELEHAAVVLCQFNQKIVPCYPLKKASKQEMANLPTLIQKHSVQAPTKDVHHAK